MVQLVKEGFNFLDQEVYDALPMLESVDKQGRTVESKVTPKVEIIQRKKIRLSNERMYKETRDRTTGARGDK